MRYRRAKLTGASYFFTVNLANRKSRLLVEHVDMLRESARRVKTAHPFVIDAMVIMPSHLHCLWTLPEDDNDFSTRWGLIKAGFSRHFETAEHISSSRKSKGERGIWQRRFWEHLIRDDHDFERHVDYIHYNPVKHGYVKRPVDWAFSSIHRYIKAQIIDENWACGDDFERMSFGEA
ncbi:MAG: transposase [Methylovulum sp.]|nr:transposase [Methylovulum sp.]